MIRFPALRVLVRVAMRAAVAAGVTVGFVVATATPARAAAQMEIDHVETGAHPEVSVRILATGELAATDLAPETFRLTENGEPRAVRVERLGGEGLEVVLVVDVSGSMAGSPMEAARAAAAAFVDRMPGGTRIGMVAFGDTAEVASPVTEDRGAVKAALASLGAGGETALYDALSATVAQFETSASGARRAVVVLSDGGDTVSTATLDQVTAQLAGLDADFSAVSLVSAEADAAALEQLAAAAGGSVVPADSPERLAEAFGAVAARLTSQYRLTYRSTAGGAVNIRVSVDHGDLSVAAEASVSLAALTPAAPAARPPSTEVAGDPGLLAQEWMLPAGAPALGLGLAVALSVVFRPSQTQRRLAREDAGEGAGGGGTVPMVSEIGERATAFAERVLENRGRQGALDRALDSAGIAMRPGEFVVLAATASLSAVAVGVAFAGLLPGLVLGASVATGFRWSLGHRARRRRARFGDQLGDTLQLLAGSLRTGYGLLQALDAVASEAESPTSEEFRRVIVEARLGRDLSDSLRSLADRIQSPDFEWVIQAIQIHREIGGDLSEILDRVGETIRDRNRIRRQVRALSAEGRLSAAILFALPFFVGLAVKVINPGYVAELTQRSGGRMLLGVAGLLMAGGGLWLRRLVRPQF